MPSESLKQVIMRRDALSSAEADDLIDKARDQLTWYLNDCDIESAEDICNEFFGLESDYITELISAS